MTTLEKTTAKDLLGRLYRRLKKEAALELGDSLPPKKEEDSSMVSLDMEDLLAGSRRLIAINRGESEPDDRDSLAFKRIYSTGDLIAERIKIDAEKTARTLLRKLNQKRSLKNLPSGIFNRYTEGHIVGNPLSSPLEETNPIQLLEQQFRITQMGPGGIGSESALTEEAQNVNPSEFGFIDPLAGPECFVAGSYVFTRRGWVRWEHVTEDDEFLTVGDLTTLSEPYYVCADRLVREHYEGPVLYWRTRNTCGGVTPNHRMLLRDGDGKPFATPAENLFSLEQSFQLLMSQPGSTVPSAAQQQKEYSGYVYCATVPTGMLYVKGDKDTFGYWSGNSSRAGVDVRATHNSRLGSDGRIYQRFFNPRLNRYEWLSARDLMGKTVGYAP